MDTFTAGSRIRGPLTKKCNRVVKRTFDVLVSVVVLLVIFPVVTLVVSIVTTLTMPGHIFFRQRRTGKDGREFMMLKYRSMRVNPQADVVQATEDDPRKTRWGDVMRRTSLDEFPQFINVLIGDMSVVGPRPHMIRQTEEYSRMVPNYADRLTVRPGITGWSQVSGFRGEVKDGAQLAGRIGHDIWYIEHWSPWLDIRIIFLTLYKTFAGDKQAY